MDKKQPIENLIFLDTDVSRLKQLIQNKVTENNQTSNALFGEIMKARIVSKSELPEDVVIMNSTIEIEDMEDKEITNYTLVYPSEADIDAYKVSILAPIGTALIGYKKHDEIRWKMPGGIRRLKIKSVKHPPAIAAN